MEQQIKSFSDDKIEYYKRALLSIVKSEELHNYINKDSINVIILAFSFYICNTDSAYKYNLPFLIYQFNKMKKFVEGAIKKYKNLNEVISKILDYKNISDFLLRNPEFKKCISITINDFLIETLEKEINFLKKPNFSGADRKEINDIYTIRYTKDGQTKLITCKIKFLEDKKDFTQIIQYTETLLKLKNNKGKGRH